ncbi:hypothetical protein D3C85_1507900 [compost metagenome]
MAIRTATVSAPRKLPTKTKPQCFSMALTVTPGRLSNSASGVRTKTPVKRSKPIRYRMQKPTGNRAAPRMGESVCTVTVTANTAAIARMAPAMKARIRTSRVAM